MYSSFLSVSDFVGLRLCSTHSSQSACRRACISVKLLYSVLTSFFFLSQRLINFTPNLHSNGRDILSYHTISYTHILFTAVLISCRPCSLQDIGHSKTSVRPPFIVCLQMGTFNCMTSIRPPSDLSFFAVGYIELCGFNQASERPIVCLQLGTFNCTTSIRPPSDLSFVCSWVHSTARLQSGLPAGCHLCTVYDFNSA